MATEQASLNGWTVIHDKDNGGYTLECKDNNFDTQIKTITMDTADKSMDGNVVVTVKAKTGSAPVATALTGTDASASLNGTTITLTKVVTNEGSSFTKGWIETKPTGNVTLTVTGTVPTETKSCTPSSSTQTITPTAGKLLSSVTVRAVPTETKYISPKTAGTWYYPSSGTFISGAYVYSTSFSDWIPKVSNVYVYKNQDKYTFPIAVNQIAIICHVNNAGSTTASKVHIRWMNNNAASTSSSTITSWDNDIYRDSFPGVGYIGYDRGSCIYCTKSSSGYTWIARAVNAYQDTGGCQSMTQALITLGTSADFNVNVYQDNYEQEVYIFTLDGSWTGAN